MPTSSAHPTDLVSLPFTTTTTTKSQETVWVDSGLDASFIFHFAAAWEEAPGTMKLFAHKYDHFELDFEGTIFKNASDQQPHFTRADLDARCVKRL